MQFHLYLKNIFTNNNKNNIIRYELSVRNYNQFIIIYNKGYKISKKVL